MCGLENIRNCIQYKRKNTYILTWHNIKIDLGSSNIDKFFYNYICCHFKLFIRDRWWIYYFKIDFILLIDAISSRYTNKL